MRLSTFLLLCMAAVANAQPEIAWEEDFDDASCLDRARFFVWDRYNQSGWDDKLLVKQFDGGVFRYGLHYDETRKNDWVNLVYGNIVWGHKNWPAWGPFDLKQYPILEIRWRGMEHLCLYYGKETAAGKKIQDYTYPKVTRKETDAQGREWNISIIRFAMDSSVPGPYTPTKLLGINPQVTTPTKGKDEVLEIDYIRVRGLNKEEAAREAGVIETLADFPKGRWKGHDTFFPWGVYGTGFLRGPIEWWAGDYEGAYGIYSRHHINFVATNYEVELSRVGGAGIGTDDWPAAVDRYAAAVAPPESAARRRRRGKRPARGRDGAGVPVVVGRGACRHALGPGHHAGVHERSVEDRAGHGDWSADRSLRCVPGGVRVRSAAPEPAEPGRGDGDRPDLPPIHVPVPMRVWVMDSIAC